METYLRGEELRFESCVTKVWQNSSNLNHKEVSRFMNPLSHSDVFVCVCVCVCVSVWAWLPNLVDYLRQLWPIPIPFICSVISISCCQIVVVSPLLCPVPVWLSLSFPVWISSSWILAVVLLSSGLFIVPGSWAHLSPHTISGLPIKIPALHLHLSVCLPDLCSHLIDLNK